jgi:hypothetical protein
LKRLHVSNVHLRPMAVLHLMYKVGDEKSFCAPHYTNALLARAQATRLGAGPATGAIAIAHVSLSGCAARNCAEGYRIVSSKGRRPRQSQGPAHNSSLLPDRAGRGVSSTVTKASQPSIKHFPIDPVKAAELLAHGAMGARNALRGDRSRDNRAQSV